MEKITEQDIKQNLEQEDNWLDAEAKALDNYDGEQTPALKLEPGKITKFEVDFSKEFDRWDDPDNKTIKKIIPVTHDGEKKVLWLNTRNPLYRQLILAGKNGQTEFQVMRTGEKNQTRYTLVEK